MAPMKLSIRPAAAADADAIARIHVDSWRDAYPTLLPDSYLVERLSEARQRAACRTGSWSQIIDQVQDFSEQVTEPCDLAQLKGDVHARGLSSWSRRKRAEGE